MEKNGCIYLIRCLESRKGYVGQHIHPDPKRRWVSHIRSAKNGCKYLLHQAIRKYGSEAFTIEILCICSISSLGNMESYYAEQFETYCWDSPGGYNMVWCGNQPRIGISNSPEARNKMSIAMKGKKVSPETKEKIRLAKLGKSLTPEQLEVHHRVHKGRKKTPEEIEKLRIASTGKKQSPETIAKAKANRSPTVYTDDIRQKMSDSQHNKPPPSDEARANMSKAQIGRKHSEETLAKMSVSQTGVSKGLGVSKSEEHKEKMRQARIAFWAKKKEEQKIQPIDPPKVYRCETCSYDFSTNSKLNRHNSSKKHIDKVNSESPNIITHIE